MHLASDIVVSPLVVIPVFTLGVIGLADLPAFGGIVEPLLESPQLLFFADVEKEFENDGAVGGMASLEVVDLRVALRPDGLRHQIVHAHNQYVFVVGAIEDGDFAPLGHLRFDAPQKIVSQFLLGWLFEVGDAAAVGIHGADDVLDHAVFAAGIKRLQADKQRTLSFRKELLLQFVHLFAKSQRILRRAFSLLCCL